jgi:hypothetical protein
MAARITIQAVGALEDNGDLRFAEFIEQLNAVRVALRHTERLVTGATEAQVYYRVVDLHKASPATIVLEPRPIPAAPDAPPTRDYSGPIVDTFFANLRHIMTQRTIPKNVDMLTVESYINLGVTVEKHVTELVIANAGEQVTIARGFKSAVEAALGPDEFCEGSVTGTLDQVNIHKGTRRFYVYPIVGPARVSCEFPPHLRDDVKRGLDNYVRVTGELRYKKFDPFPYAVRASGIESLPPEDKLPTLLDIYGIAPDATGTLSAEEFLASIRDDDW